jgi:SAM-dependent methyltransferase
MPNWYDYPEFYDLAFRDETEPEVDSIEAACRRFASRPVRRMLEAGCGSGRLVVELARRGYDVAGFDTNEKSLAYLRQRLARANLHADAFAADMADFRVSKPVDVVLNTFNTFRHLTSEFAAESHLRCVSDSLRPGGLFILGLHLLPLDASEECTERWTAKQGRTRVTFTLRVTSTSRRQRIERLKVSMLVRSPRRELRVATEFPLRMYTAGQLRRLLARVPALELCAVYDFNYELDRPLPLNDVLSDTVLVLRKRGELSHRRR